MGGLFNQGGGGGGGGNFAGMPAQEPTGMNLALRGLRGNTGMHRPQAGLPGEEEEEFQRGLRPVVPEPAAPAGGGGGGMSKEDWLMKVMMPNWNRETAQDAVDGGGRSDSYINRLMPSMFGGGR